MLLLTIAPASSYSFGQILWRRRGRQERPVGLFPTGSRSSLAEQSALSHLKRIGAPYTTFHVKRAVVVHARAVGPGRGTLHQRGGYPSETRVAPASRELGIRGNVSAFGSMVYGCCHAFANRFCFRLYVAARTPLTAPFMELAAVEHEGFT